MCCYNDGNNRHCMRSAVKVLHIQGVIEDLRNGIRIEGCLTYFEFENVDRITQDDQHVNPLPHPWNGEF